MHWDKSAQQMNIDIPYIDSDERVVCLVYIADTTALCGCFHTWCSLSRDSCEWTCGCQC